MAFTDTKREVRLPHYCQMMVKVLTFHYVSSDITLAWRVKDVSLQPDVSGSPASLSPVVVSTDTGSGRYSLLLSKDESLISLPYIL